jgi:chromosome segregation ATPase
MERPNREPDWEHWPEDRKLDDGLRSRLRHLFAPTTGDQEAAIEGIITERSRELEQQAARLAETIADLEHREERTRELRNAVEQMLRRGSAELDERHAELNALSEALAAREAQLREGEEDLAHRRQELGAVELHRAAVVRREEAAEERLRQLLERERDLTDRAARLDEREQELAARESDAAAVQAGVETAREELSGREAELASLREELAARAERAEAAAGQAADLRRELTAREASLAARARALADTEEEARRLERLRVELAERETQLDEERRSLARSRDELAGAVATASAGLGIGERPSAEAAGPEAHLLFVPSGGSYRLIDVDGPAPAPGDVVEADGVAYLITRVGRSPLPGDARRCAYAEPAGDDPSPVDG